MFRFSKIDSITCDVPLDPWIKGPSLELGTEHDVSTNSI